MNWKMKWLTALGVLSVLVTVAGEDSEVLSPKAFIQGKNSLKWNSFAEMNAYYENEFVNAQGFGISRMPKLEAFKEFEVAGNSYRVSRVQLVGIVDRDKPAVYQTHAWFRKEMLKTAEHRAPTADENAALGLLAKGREWVSLSGHEGVLLGALRAKASCVKCHENSKPEQLLGALRYELRPSPNQWKSQPKQPQPKSPQEPAVPTT